MLSILILTTPRRVDNFCPNLIKYLFGQIQKCKAEKDVQLLWLGDNYSMTIGRKRNELIRMADKKYVVFIDDDDSVSCDYIEEVLSAIKTNPNIDVVVYDCLYTINGKQKTLLKCGKDMPKYVYEENGIKQWRGPVGHTLVWKKEIASKYRFPETSFDEERDWIFAANKDIRTEVRIDKPLYFYRYSSSTTEIKGRNDYNENAFH